MVIMSKFDILSQSFYIDYVCWPGRSIGSWMSEFEYVIRTYVTSTIPEPVGLEHTNQTYISKLYPLYLSKHISDLDSVNGFWISVSDTL